MIQLYLLQFSHQKIAFTLHVVKFARFFFMLFDREIRFNGNAYTRVFGGRDMTFLCRKWLWILFEFNLS